jgi:hypothetical protein
LFPEASSPSGLIRAGLARALPNPFFKKRENESKMIDELLTTEPSTADWFLDPTVVRAFILDTFGNNRDRLSLQTARLWYVLIERLLPTEIPYYTKPPTKVGNWFDEYARLQLAAGGYPQYSRPPALTKRTLAESFGLPKNAVKQHIRRLRREAEKVSRTGRRIHPQTAAQAGI